MSWDSDAEYEEEGEYAYAIEREAELEEAEKRREKERMDAFDVALDAYEAKGRCTCMAEGEDPHCPDHGYEAVIRRLNAALEEVHDFASNEVAGEDGTWIVERVEQAFKSPPHAFEMRSGGAEAGRNIANEAEEKSQR
jgi:hypothetical protein